MNPKIRIFLFCPVPDNQKPIHEFILVQESFFFSFLTFLKKRVKIFLVLFFFSLIFFYSFSLILFIFFLPFLFRWSQLQSRFNNSRLLYEEGSWYDVQIWEKPLSLIKNERLINTQKIQPILNQIFNLSFFVCFFLFFKIIIN